MKLSLLSPERKLLDQVEVTSVTLTGSEGMIQILPGHAGMVGTLETGPFIIEGPGLNEFGVISTGFFEVKQVGDNEVVSVLAETVELKGEIDSSRAKAAQAKAEAGLQDADLDEHKFKKYQLKLSRALIRQQVAGGAIN
jgi:F-type H+-transporting ATPase subunit epsilon